MLYYLNQFYALALSFNTWYAGIYFIVNYD